MIQAKMVQYIYADRCGITLRWSGAVTFFRVKQLRRWAIYIVLYHDNFIFSNNVG